MFQVIDTATSEVLRTYGTGKVAGQVSARYNKMAARAGIERRTRVTRGELSDGERRAWRIREARRLTSGEYAPVPWDVAHMAMEYAPDVETARAFRDTFVHLSSEDPCKVAYTPDDAYGVQDRQIRTTPGKFLRKFFSELDMSDADVERFAAQVRGGTSYDIADTPSDIESVYTGGPSSCMSYSPYDFSSPEHPTRVYGAGDLAVAYTGDMFQATARCLVWPEQRRRSRVYGLSVADIELLEQALADDGYTTGRLDGARLLRIEDPDSPGRFVCPFIDGGYFVQDDGTHLIIDSNSGLDASDTSGWTYGACCCECGDVTDYATTVHGDALCEYCAARCGACDEYVPSSYIAGTLANGDGDICEACAYDSRDYVACDCCDDWADTCDTVELASGDVYCDSCASDEAAECGECGEYHEASDVAWNDDVGDDLCIDCHAKLSGDDAVERSPADRGPVGVARVADSPDPAQTSNLEYDRLRGTWIPSNETSVI